MPSDNGLSIFHAHVSSIKSWYWKNIKKWIENLDHLPIWCWKSSEILGVCVDVLQSGSVSIIGGVYDKREKIVY